MPWRIAMQLTETVRTPILLTGRVAIDSAERYGWQYGQDERSG
jgi:hypothetical protein